jgi:molecular chaperone GrpE|tara:strand:- start:125 stop:667 length:543 start_codon:yes stop_codon:yes gene_type:complete
MIQQEPGEDQTTKVTQEVAEVKEIELVKKALAEEKTRAEGYLASWQRAQADFVNYKRRTEQNRQEMGKFANSVLILSLLPILDDLERALDSVPPRLAKLAWVDGVRLIWRKLRENLQAQGLTPIVSEGEPFDPNLHEAAMYSKGREGVVVRELQKGYKLYDKILRPAVVAVGNGKGARKL